MSDMPLEKAEREYDARIEVLQRRLDELYPDEVWDAEDYEALMEAMEKDH